MKRVYIYLIKARIKYKICINQGRKSISGPDVHRSWIKLRSVHSTEMFSWTFFCTTRTFNQSFALRLVLITGKRMLIIKKTNIFHAFPFKSLCVYFHALLLKTPILARFAFLLLFYNQSRIIKQKQNTHRKRIRGKLVEASNWVVLYCVHDRVMCCFLIKIKW